MSLSDSSTEHPFAPFVRTLGRGKRSRRNLERDEARAALALLLDGNVTPAQTGAFLMLLRVQEETPAELAGFLEATRAWVAKNIDLSNLRPALDWPSYSGKKKHHPWYLLSAWLLASRGHRVLMHGESGTDGQRCYTETLLPLLGLEPARDVSHATAQLDSNCFAYLPLEVFCPPLVSLLGLRRELGLRSPLNTLVRSINPGNAPVSLQGIFHPPYLALHQQAALLLNEVDTLIFKGQGGEVELRPDARTLIQGTRNGKPLEMEWPPVIRRAEPPPAPEPAALLSLWRGELKDDYGEHAVVETTGLALWAMHQADTVEDARQQARQYWQDRDTNALPLKG